MRKEKISFKETGNFSKKFLDFINGESESYFPSEKNILSQQKNQPIVIMHDGCLS